MRSAQFQTWFAGLALLNQPQRGQVRAALQPSAGLERVIALIEQIRSDGRCCPGCQCTRWVRHGHANDLQRYRYRCRQCERTFNDLSGTPLARLRRRGQWLDYLAALAPSMSRT